jgi:antitoxin YefM
MHITYRLRADQLDENFLEDLQKTYKDKEIEIIVYEVNETKYLLKNNINKQRLLEAKNNIEKGIYLVEVNLDNL